MDNILITHLKTKIKELQEAKIRDNAILIALKEELQYYVLDFVYNSKKYSGLTMYGGSLLRIGYGLNRMSEDLDFQTNKEIDRNYLAGLKKDLIEHFKNKFDQDLKISVSKKRISETKLLVLRFNILEDLGLNISYKVLKLRLDINLFEKTNQFITETIPIVRDNLVFSIKTYPLSTLMASKILAVLRRKERWVKSKQTNCKPRDIYDLIWYLEKNIYPDIEYLKAKGEKFNNLLELFEGKEGIIFRVNNINDNAFKDDLAQFFYDSTDCEMWLDDWRAKFNNLMKKYALYEVGKLDWIKIQEDFLTMNTYFYYRFKIKNKDGFILFTVKLGWWYDSDRKIAKGNRMSQIEKKIIKTSDSIREYDYEYASLFYKKIKDFLKRNNNIITQDKFVTKLIRTTSDKINPKEQIWLNAKLLKEIDFEELL